MIDYYILQKLVTEIAPKVNGAAIRTVGSFRQTISFQTGDNALFVYLNPDEARIEYGPSHTLAESDRQHPFIAFLSKELGKGRIASLSMEPLERIVYLDIDKLTHLGMKWFRIVIEFSSRPCTAYVLDNGEIVSAFRLVRDERELVPGDRYVVPTSSKKDVFITDINDILSYGDKASYGEYLMQNFMLPPHLVKEITARAESGEEIAKIISALSAGLKSDGAYVYALDGKTFVSAIPYVHGECLLSSDSVNDAVRKYYFEILGKEIALRQKKEMVQVCQKRLKHNEKILDTLTAEALDFSDAERFKQSGDLLLTYGYMVKGYLKEITVPGYDGNDVTIVIDPDRGISENAERYYKKYQKAKRAGAQLDKRRAVVESEQQFLRDTLFFIEQSDDAVVFAEIKLELEEQGIIKTPRDKKQKEAKKKRPPSVQFEGFTIIYGRTAQENEFVTLKMANDQDMWLHVQKMPGAHVIIKSPDGLFPESVMNAAAQIAVHFSKAKGGSKVPVDYTKKKHIRKPKGTPPGFVLYENFKTVITDYDAKMIEQMIKRYLEHVL